ncbi:PREDICTED: LOW QUALITY PROTEIN: histone-lysine N-methyltransferase NSD2-like [Priapulus caudatus]|uniref:LOW QUALITY PROTEIN: histone-lysine N-methyltransferase NSD2-like n=1 Tax=Priapulus caudatus TaxID=37621 RepID=A0ABM1ETQ3_PRICU|nr:PREDICTED: LOW QUALITY PROTEIN: histone-lysine N-methyltransferase NSD2-like [Priapulus caudatus]
MQRCVRCPAAYHSGDACVPAGATALTAASIVCPRHFRPAKARRAQHANVNVNWCFVCGRGGALLCCESCPTAFHAGCVGVAQPPDGAWYCEDCTAGRQPLFGDIVWVKLGCYRWWPARICPPRAVPDNVFDLPHGIGEFPVCFFGSHDYYWLHKGRVFYFDEGDKGSKDRTSSAHLAKQFHRAVVEATDAFKAWQASRESRVAQESERSGRKPAPYKHIKTNRPVGKVQIYTRDPAELTPCECAPTAAHPCGYDGDCLNAMMYYECHPAVCPAGERCENQRFVKMQYAACAPTKVGARGWGLRALEPVRKGQFVGEYVGDLIDDEECRRRLRRSHEDNVGDFYMLTIDKDRVIDAGPKGNLTRFMNHDCAPNCETQKWTVNGDVRVGLFALRDVAAGEELTFNYNLDCLGNEKRPCLCGAPRCSGFIGVRPKGAADNGGGTAAAGNGGEEPARRAANGGGIADDDDVLPPADEGGERGDVRPADVAGKVYHTRARLPRPSLARPHGRWQCPSGHHCDDCGRAPARCSAAALPELVACAAHERRPRAASRPTTRRHLLRRSTDLSKLPAARRRRPGPQGKMPLRRAHKRRTSVERARRRRGLPPGAAPARSTATRRSRAATSDREQRVSSSEEGNLMIVT